MKDHFPCRYFQEILQSVLGNAQEDASVSFEMCKEMCKRKRKEVSISNPQLYLENNALISCFIKQLKLPWNLETSSTPPGWWQLYVPLARHLPRKFKDITFEGGIK